MMNRAEELDRERARLAGLTLDQAETEVVNAIYAAALIFERLEHAGVVRGNGHHMAQEMSAAAEKLLRERWIAPDERSPR